MRQRHHGPFCLCVSDKMSLLLRSKTISSPHLLFLLPAVCSEEEWAEMIAHCGYDAISIRDARYNQVVHMMTAAKGAEPFYQLDNPARSEGLELARELDSKAATVSTVVRLMDSLFPDLVITMHT